LTILTLRKHNPVPVGANPRLIADFVIIVINVFENPEIFIMRSKEVQKRLLKRQKNSRISYRFPTSGYENFEDKWELIWEV